MTSQALIWRCDFISLRFLNTTLRLGPLIRASASFMLRKARFVLLGLLGLLTGDEVPVVVVEEFLRFFVIVFVVLCTEGVKTFILLRVRFLSLRNAFMWRFFVLIS